MGISYFQVKKHQLVFWVGSHVILESSIESNTSVVLKGNGEGNHLTGYNFSL